MKFIAKKWLYSVKDQDGIIHRQVTHAISRDHASKVVKSRIKNGSPILGTRGVLIKSTEKNINGGNIYAAHKERIGRIVCV